MNKQRKIPVRELVGDIIAGRLEDRAIMAGYDLDHRAFVYILGHLAKKRKISFKRVIRFIRDFLNEENVEFAEASLHVIEKHYAGVWGVPSMIKGLERDLLETKNRLEFQRDMEKVSKTLEWFDVEHPGAFLHPSIVSSIRNFENCAEKILDNGLKLVANHPLFDARSRLSLYSEYIPFFEKYGPAEAIRVWHYISVVLFARKGVEHFVVKGIMDAATCDVCMHMDGTRISVARVLATVGELKKRGPVLPDKPFPSPISVEDLSRDEKEDALIDNGWFLPPFCENCRCQIFPRI